MIRRLALLSPCFPLALALGGCGDATQLVVVVDTNLDVPGELDQVEIVVTGPSGDRTTTTEDLASPEASAFPLTLSIVPASDALGPVAVVAIGRLAGTDVVRASVRTTLARGESRVVHLLLLRSCVGRACAADETCGPGGCASPDVAFGDLGRWTGSPPTFDDSDPCLAMPWDVDRDGHGQTACGGTDCDDAVASTYGGAIEECNDADDDCDGVTDEDCACAPLASRQPCTGGCGSTGTRTCTPTGWGPCEPPAEVCNGLDDDCDGAADEGFDYVVGTESRVTNDPNQSERVALAWAGDRFLAVWADDPAADEQGIYQVALDPAGALLGTPARVARDGDRPAIAWSGSVAAVTYWDRDQTCDSVGCTYDDYVYLAITSADGAAVAAPVEITRDAENESRPRVVWDGTGFAVSYREDALYLRLFGADGASRGPRILVTSSNDETAELAFTGTGYALTYARGDRLYLSEGTSAGFGMPAVLPTGGARPGLPSVASAGGRYVIAYLDTGSGSVGSLSVGPAGASPTTPSVLSASGSPNGSFGRAPPAGVAAGEAQVLVAFTDRRDGNDEIYFARVAPDGTVLQAATRVSNAPASSMEPAAAFTGTRFGLAWSDARERRGEIYATTVGCP